MIRIAILASGSGSNAENIAKYFKGSEEIDVSLIMSNNKDAYVLERAENLSIPSLTFTKKELNDAQVLKYLQSYKIDFIILAGFLLLVPENLVEAYPGRIINIHPALLPKFGGKGMYGDRVHQAVVDAGSEESGITIHFVNDKYDEGEVIFQASCAVSQQDTPEMVADKVHQLEYQHYPQVIESVIKKSIKK